MQIPDAILPEVVSCVQHQHWNLDMICFNCGETWPCTTQQWVDKAEIKIAENQK